MFYLLSYLNRPTQFTQITLKIAGYHLQLKAVNHRYTTPLNYRYHIDSLFISSSTKIKSFDEWIMSIGCKPDDWMGRELANKCIGSALDFAFGRFFIHLETCHLVWSLYHSFSLGQKLKKKKSTLLVECVLCKLHYVVVRPLQKTGSICFLNN